MTDLVALATTGKGSWSEVAKIINQADWSNIYIITNDFGLRKFSVTKRINFVIIDTSRSAEEVKEAIMSQLKDKLSMDVAINMESGSGKEHMAVISALFNFGVSIRVVSSGNEKIKEI